MRISFTLALALALANTNTCAEPPTIVDKLTIAPAWSGHSVGYWLHTEAPYQYVAYYDINRALTVAMRTLDSREWTSFVLPERVNWDSHHYITMAVDEQGYIHLSGNMHSDPLVYFRTTKPHDITTLVRIESMIGEDEERCTYPQFLRDAKGNLLFIYRSGKSGDGVQLVNSYDTATQTWSRLLAAPLFDGLGKVSCYPEGPVLGPDGYFHLVWVWRVHGGCETNHNLCYARTRDMVHWETATGEPLALPITPNAEKTIIDPVPIEGGMINESTVVGFDHIGRTVLSYHKFDANGNTQIYNARFEEQSWNIHQTSDWDHRWYFSGGGTIEVDIDLGPVSVDTTGALIQGFKHVNHGSGLWVLDPVTLKPIETRPAGMNLLPNLATVESTFPDMVPRWKEDTGPSRNSDTRYFLRWEAPLVNRDKRREVTPEPSTLNLYTIENAQYFDLKTHCLHDGYF